MPHPYALEARIAERMEEERDRRIREETLAVLKDLRGLLTKQDV